MPTSSQSLTSISSSNAFYVLASSIDPRITSDAAAKMLADFREVVRAEALREAAANVSECCAIRLRRLAEGGAR